jgi:2-deoxy-D-gluconate 3-dehydrogenase
MSPFELAGRVAIVTGGNGGIGLGMARGLAAQGAAVLIAGRDAGKLATAEAELAAAGARVASFAGDLASDGVPQAMVAAAETAFGRVDILIANAGLNIRRAPEDYDAADWQKVIDVNLTSVFRCCQAVHPAMKRAGGGKIITIGSMTSLMGGPLLAPYGASKGAIVTLTKSLAAAWARDNIQVNAVLPGWIDTELTQRARREIAGLDAKIVARTPSGRWGNPADLAGIAVFLGSPASDFVTGTAIPVDGGYSAALL